VVRRFLWASGIAALVCAGCGRDAPGIRTSLTPPPPLDGGPDSLLGLLVVPADSLARFETREHGYEESSIVVYGIGGEGAWLLGGLAGGGRDWIRRDAGEFLPLEPLLRDRLTYLTEDWPRSLRFAPDARSLPRGVAITGESDPTVPARLLGTRVVDGALWLEVEALDGICEADPPRVVARGWTPAWVNAKPVMWFHSRGC
jgi:hypothetical protein